MKKTYEKPSLVAVKLESQDIICDSKTGTTNKQDTGAEKTPIEGNDYDQANGDVLNW